MVSSGPNGGPDTPTALSPPRSGPRGLAYLPRSAPAGLGRHDLRPRAGGKHVAGPSSETSSRARTRHGPVGYYRPVPVATFWLGARLSTGAVAHPRAGIVFHAWRGTLFVLLVRRLGKGSDGAAAVGALAWALPPRQRGAGGLGLGRYDLLAGLLAVASSPCRGVPGRAVRRCTGSSSSPACSPRRASWRCTGRAGRRPRLRRSLREAAPAGGRGRGHRRLGRAARLPGHRRHGTGAARQPARALPLDGDDLPVPGRRPLPSA